mmetsp:Transcript_30554/g.76491  ORF Transcript_30554/g.76491 Transcript_30554/m.76491 type:complete len:205 (-) Transcript_30554:330-944(-)
MARGRSWSPTRSTPAKTVTTPRRRWQSWRRRRPVICQWMLAPRHAVNHQVRGRRSTTRHHRRRPLIGQWMPAPRHAANHQVRGRGSTTRHRRRRPLMGQWMPDQRHAANQQRQRLWQVQAQRSSHPLWFQLKSQPYPQGRRNHSQDALAVFVLLVTTMRILHPRLRPLAAVLLRAPWTRSSSLHAAARAPRSGYTWVVCARGSA